MKSVFTATDNFLTVSCVTSGSVSLVSLAGFNLYLPESNIWQLMHLFDSTVA